MLKLKYASIIKRKQQMVDLIKQQAYIRASIFRDEIAQHELEHILKAADANVSVEDNSTKIGGGRDGESCLLEGDDPDNPTGTIVNGVCQ